MDPQGLQTSSPPSSPPSSPLSVLSKSPSMPPSPTLADPTNRYPSPLPSTPSGSESPIHNNTNKMGREGSRVITAAAASSSSSSSLEAPDGPPPIKKRKIAPEPKTRTTNYVDLSERSTAREEFHLERLLTALRRKKKVVVIAGAGISVSAGIPDFRSPTGLFATLRSEHKLKASGRHLFDASVYKHDSSTGSFHTMVRELAHQSQQARPTKFHHMLASLAKEGRLMRLYSQNIDCIDTSMEPLATNVPLNTKGPWPTTVQLHGGIDKMLCTKCGHIEGFNGDIFDTQEAPLCEKCKEQDQVRTSFAGKRSHGIGRLRPRIVLYNEYNPDEEAIGNVSNADLKARPDAVIVVGTSLKVPGVRRLVKEFCQVTRGRRDGFTAWINVDPEPQGVEFKECWDVVVKGKCDDVAEMAQLTRWDEPEIGGEAILSEEDEKLREARLNRNRVEVRLSPRPQEALTDIFGELDAAAAAAVDCKPRLAVEIQGIPTPGASPKLPLAGAPATKKAKQSKLSFAGKPLADVETSAPAKKPTRPRKPRQPKKAATATPKNTVMETFKAVKNPASTAKTPPPGKLQPESLPSNDPDSSLSSLSSLSPPIEFSDTWQLPPLRPTAKKRKPLPNGRCVIKREVECEDGKEPDVGVGARQSSWETGDQKDSLPSIVARPSTPIRMHERRKSETVSPKAIPRGMESIID
jgi:NAD+-dependent protein deacetylase SIR2